MNKLIVVAFLAVCVIAVTTAQWRYSNRGFAGGYYPRGYNYRGYDENRDGVNDA